MHAKDLATAIELVCARAPLGEIYNVGAPLPVSIKDIVSCCAQAMDKELDEIAEVSEDRLGQDSQYWLDSSKIKALGWRQQVPLNQGIDEMVDWGKTFLDEIRALPTEYILRD